MRSPAKIRLRLAAALGFYCALSQLAVAQETVVQVDPAKSNVAFILADVLHTVHGTFRLKSGVIHFDPSTGAATGDVVIDATSGDSGNHARDKKMHNDILESQRYPVIEFLPTHVLGRVDSQGTSQVRIEGVFRLHGSDHDLVLTFPVEVNGNRFSGNIHFEVPYEAWGLKNPSTLFLRVSNKVQIDITATGTLETGSGTKPSR